MDVKVPCHCPGEPHADGDTITFRERLGFTHATAIVNAAQLIPEKDMDIRTGLILAVMSKFCILYGVESWTLTGDGGRPVPVDTESITARVLEDAEIAAYVTDPVIDLYQKQVVDPLAVRVATSSQRSQMIGSTSRTPRGSRPRKQSKRSSITTIPTDATEMTSSSLDGDSTLSRSSESAA